MGSRPGALMTHRKKLFVDYYLGQARGVGRKAAILAGYPERSAAQRACELLKDAEVRAAIDARLDEVMSREELLHLLADEARGIGDYVDMEQLDRMNLLRPDWERIRADGKMHLIRGWEYTREGQLIVQWCDPQAARALLARMRGFEKPNEVNHHHAGTIIQQHTHTVDHDLTQLDSEDLARLYREALTASAKM